MARPRRTLCIATIIGALALGLAALTRSATPAAATLVAAPSSDPSRLLWTEMRNVNLHIDQSAFMRLWLLRGQVLPTTPGAVAMLDDPTSFAIRVTSGTVAVDGEALSALMNEVAFHYDGAPIRHLRIEVHDSLLVQHGIMHKGVDIPFTMTAVPKLTPDGLVELAPITMRIFGGVDGLKLLHALGLHLSSMLGGLRGAHGVTVEGDELYLDPTGILPPPAIHGRVTSLHIDGPLLVQDFATTPDDSVFRTYVQADSGARNYIYFRGGRLRFGKLTMFDTDLLIRDADESDPFDLMLSEYNKQLVAGHTKNLPDYGLRTFMVDYNKLGKAPTIAER